MLRDAVRGVVVVAAGIAEEAGRRVVGAASDLLERSGVDVAAVEKRVGEQLPPSVKSLQILATEAVTVGRAGVDLAVGVARGEVERVFERVGDQMVKVGVVLSYLEGKLRSVDEEEPPAPRAGAKPANRADGLFDAGWDDDDVPEPVHFAPDTAPATAPDGTAEPAGTAEPDTGTEPQREKPAAARPAAAKKPPAKKTAAQPSAAKKGAAKKTTAKKTTTRKATAKRTVAQPPTAKKAATKKTVVKKTVTRRPAPKEDGGA
ncbi:histone H1-like repetitive region-containing protein [Kitasatospora sp. NPDC085879]|uniref:histone H1-like repetitive region-containing protein n=1 Tax=Kitasatospora sp. NPDC085879 TaxID=3154769 RepID=UPI003416FC25